MIYRVTKIGMIAYHFLSMSIFGSWFEFVSFCVMTHFNMFKIFRNILFEF